MVCYELLVLKHLTIQLNEQIEEDIQKAITLFEASRKIPSSIMEARYKLLKTIEISIHLSCFACENKYACKVYLLQYMIFMFQYIQKALFCWQVFTGFTETQSSKYKIIYCTVHDTCTLHYTCTCLALTFVSQQKSKRYTYFRKQLFG